MAPFAVLDLSGLNRPSATASILRFIKRSTEFRTDTGASHDNLLATVAFAFRFPIRPLLAGIEMHLLGVLTKKSLEIQAVLFGTTFVERTRLPAENQFAVSAI